MHVTGTLDTSYNLHVINCNFHNAFVFDRTACVKVRIRVRRHFVMSIIKRMNLIRVHYFLDISGQRGHSFWDSTVRCSYFWEFYRLNKYKIK